MHSFNTFIGFPGRETRVYEEFCNQIFGKYLDRPILVEDDKDTKCGVAHKYELTMTYMRTFDDTLRPIRCLWPDYTHENYVSDNHSTIWVTPIGLAKLIKDVNLKVRRNDKTIDYVKFGELTNEAIITFEKTHAKKPVKPEKFSQAKFKPKFQKKNLDVNKIFKLYDNNSIGDKSLLTRVARKYALDNETATAWIMEFKKFFIIKLIQTDPSNEENSFPSSIVENVWTTYMELGNCYREFSNILFQETVYPESILSYQGDIEQLTQRYSKTLELYQEFYGQEPILDLWETPEQRFAHLTNDSGAGVEVEHEESKQNTSDDPNGRVAVNVYRTFAVKVIRSIAADTFKTEKIVKTANSNDDLVKSTKLNLKQRQKDAQSKNLYKWRKHYPHCNNVYVGTVLKDESVVYVHNPYESLAKTKNLFTQGGLLFLPNPHYQKLLQDRTLAEAILTNHGENMPSKSLFILPL
jgi:hypothetical protein